MMKWGRKKSYLASPSSHSSSSTSSFFHLSWFSKIKQTRKKFECKPSKGEKNEGCKGLQTPANWKNSQFYGGGDDSDWRLSFREENNEEEREKSLKFNQMVSNIRKLKELPNFEATKGRRNEEFKGTRRKFAKGRKLKKKNGDLGEKKIDFEKQLDKAKKGDLVLQEKDIFGLNHVRLTRANKRGNYIKGASFSNRDFETIEEDYKLEATKLNEERVKSDWEKMREMKFKELMAKSESHRKSIYIKTSNSRKVRAYSPRTAYKIECKIKVIENMKRAKKKTEKKTIEKITEGKTAFDSFAVVKNSFDPRSDFKNSMIEMITVRNIKKSEELEELLACYLTLNADIYHDTIIKVFKQVWFELIRNHPAPVIQN